jgi:glycosyltransferase involved in cell wall biosynthesis
VRIAIVAPPWVAVPPTGYGGTELVIDGLCRALSQLGHDVLLCATGDSECPVERVWAFDVARGTEHMDPAAELRHVITAYTAIAKWRADIVHDHTAIGPFYTARHPDLLVVTTNHGPFCGERAAIYRALVPRVPTIAISHDQAARAPGIEVAGVIHHGVDTDRFPFGSGRGGYAAFVGRMTPDKGIVRAIRVARSAGVPLRIAAKMREPAERTFFDERVKPLLVDGVEFLGEVDGNDKLKMLGDARCLLNPISWPEPFGMVMIEALACGTPVVATPDGAAPEIVDDGVTGFLSHDDVELARAVTDISRLERTGCREVVTRRFSTHRMATNHVRLYERQSPRRHPLSLPRSTGRTGVLRDPLEAVVEPRTQGGLWRRTDLLGNDPPARSQDDRGDALHREAP